MTRVQYYDPCRRVRDSLERVTQAPWKSLPCGRRVRTSLCNVLLDLLHVQKVDAA
jgi:hypothetical protein